MTTATPRVATDRPPAIRAVIILMTGMAVCAVLCAALSAYALTRESAGTAGKLAAVVARAPVDKPTDVVGLAGEMRALTIVSIVFSVLAIVVAGLSLWAVSRAFYRGRILIWACCLLLGIPLLIRAGMEPTSTFDTASGALQAAELAMPGAASLYAQLMPGWYVWVYYLFELILFGTLVATSIMLLRPGMYDYFMQYLRPDPDSAEKVMDLSRVRRP